MHFSLNQLSLATGGQWIGSPPDANVWCTGVTTDSRQVAPGQCFLAIRGEHVDGHAYVEQALLQGAACCVVDRDLAMVSGPLLRVDNVTAALGQLAGAMRQRFQGTVVAVTGSVGKTTTRHMIAHLLGLRFRTHQSPKNYNNHLGLPLTILSTPDDAEMMVVELGSSAPGEIAALTRIARPNIAVTTNAYPAHLAGFGSIAAIRQEKLSISEGLVHPGTFIVGSDCPGLTEALQPHHPRAVTFGLQPGAEVQGRHVQNGPDGSTVTLEDRPVRVPLPGPGNVQNALAAWAVYRQLGGSIQEFAAGMSSLPQVDQRSELLHPGSLTVLNDCYNANPMSMRNALATLRGLHSSGQNRRVFICGDMGELGDAAESLHQELGRDIAEHGVDRVLAIGALASMAARTAAQISRGQVKISCYANTDSACESLSAEIEDKDLILVKGSRSAGLEKIVDRLGKIVNHE